MAIDKYARPFSNDPEEEHFSRLLARKHLLDFTTYTYLEYKIDTGLAIIANALQDVVENRTKRLMIWAPPQHGKSELVSIRFPAYWLGKRPDDSIILCSYGASLAFDKVFSTRQLIESPQYHALFPNTEISKYTRGGTSWRIKDHKGVVISAGVGGPITGYGAMLGIIDDPIKNWQEAESPLARERIWAWYQTTFRTRIWENGAIIIVMTRWHEDDLCGKLLNYDSSEWTVLRLPAIAETQQQRDENFKFINLPQYVSRPDPAGRSPGEPLCPSRFSKQALEKMKVDIGPLAWAAQYMGTPRAPEGNLIKRSWFAIIDQQDVPDMVSIVRYWDKAATEDGGCRTAGVLVGKDKLNKYYILDVVKGQWSTHKRDQITLQTAKSDHELFPFVTIGMEVEGGSGGMDSARASVTQLTGFTVKLDRPTGGKLTRLGPFMGQAEAGNVYIVKGTWNFDYIDELVTIPASTYMDQADATSGAFKLLFNTLWTRGASK